MKAITKFLLITGLFLVVLVYSFKNIVDLHSLINQYQNLKPQLINANQQNQQISLEVSIIQSKVLGIREATLNKDILEERAKLMMNYKNINEIVINN